MMFKNIWLCLGCFSFFVSCEQKQRTIISKPPNVVFISIDDLNDWVGFLGDKEAITPHMDSLANKGYSFLNAHCPAPVCGPSRTAILSGKWPVTTGVYDNQVNFAKDFFDTKSLPEHFKLNGYQVFGVGKIFHGRGTPINAFDAYGGRMGSSAPFDSKDLRNNKQNPSHEVIKQGKKILLPLNGMPADRYWNKSNTFDWGAVDLPDSLFADRVSVDWAIKRLEESNEKPFFMAIGFERPHQPLFNPKRFHDLFPSDKIELPSYLEDDFDDLGHRAKQLALYPKTSGRHETVIKHDQWKNAVASYRASVAFVDELIGDLVKAINQNKLSDNTWIVLWSDHGWHLGEKSHWGKGTGWYRSTRVPFLIIPPKGKNQGVQITQAVNLIDLAPTLADISGIPKQKTWEGNSLLPLINNPNINWDQSTVTTFAIGSHTISNEKWQLISYFDGTFELYDLKKDPNQFENLANQTEHQKVIDELKSNIPKEPKWKYFMRFNDYKILVPADKSSSIKIFDQASLGKVDVDIASEKPLIVQQIKAYIKKHSPANNKLIVNLKNGNFSN